MKRLNKQQDDYLQAKARYTVLQEEINNLESDYVKKLGIRNRNGNVPKFTWTIDDPEAAEKAIEEFGSILERSGMQDALNQAREELKTAENNLLDYGVSILPPGEDWEPLIKASKTNWKVRMQMIDLILRLDTSTVDIQEVAKHE